MLTVVPWHPWHIELMKAQGGAQAAQAAELAAVPPGFSELAAPPGPALSVFDGEFLLMCGGIVYQGPGRGALWSLVGDRARPHMNYLHYAAKRFIGMDHWRRLEATCEEGFPQGCRWLKLLGFEFEGLMRAYGLNGETHRRYARIR
jgi:hypothetical protein